MSDWECSRLLLILTSALARPSPVQDRASPDALCDAAAGVDTPWLQSAPSCSCTAACAAASCWTTACWSTMQLALTSLSTIQGPPSGAPYLRLVQICNSCLLRLSTVFAVGAAHSCMQGLLTAGKTSAAFRAVVQGSACSSLCGLSMLSLMQAAVAGEQRYRVHSQRPHEPSLASWTC